MNMYIKRVSWSNVTTWTKQQTVSERVENKFLFSYGAPVDLTRRLTMTTRDGMDQGQATTKSPEILSLWSGYMVSGIYMYVMSNHTWMIWILGKNIHIMIVGYRWGSPIYR